MNEIAEIFPTPERYRHGPIERDDRNQDDHGNVSRPHRAIDILAAMHKAGKITGEMRQAGQDFRNLFDRSQLDPLQCSDVGRPMVSGRRKPSAVLASRIEDARDGVQEAVNAVGGFRSDAGNLIIDVLGWGWSLKAWAEERSRTTRPVSQHEASGFIRCALGILQQHFQNKA
jgi:hypothetical protein